MSEAMLEQTENAVSGQEESTGTMERFLTFISDGLTFGVSTNYVIEIITNHSVTAIPMAPNFVKGIINLRGQIIPIIDIRLRMGKPSISYSNTSCIIVFTINSIPIGIIVDAVAQVLDIDNTKIAPVPAKNQQELVNRMTSINGKDAILLLDCEQLVNS